MKIGLGIGVTQPQNMPVASVGSPSYLFRDVAQGAWYDPSDLNLTWRRNLLTYSEQFDNAAWFKNNWSVSTNSSVAPDGSMTADKMVENTVNGFHATYYTQSLGTVTGTYSYSVYLKNAGRSWANIRFNGVSTWFDITNGAIGTIGSGVTASISSAGNGWYRCTVSAIVMSVAISPEVIMTTGDLAGVYTGDGTSGIYIWGAQLERGSTATPYQRITDGIQDYLQYQAQPVLYRDAAGTTPVTAVEQPVGLMLDKSKGLVLGPELVTNGDFSNGTTGWAINTNGTATVSSGVLTLTNGSFGFQRITQGFATTVGKTYRINCTNLSGNSRYSVSSANDYGQNVLAVQSVSGAMFTATTTTSYIVLSCYTATNGDTATFDNISVRELPGNHAFNSSGNSANFPVLSARYNLLTKTEAFDDAVWTKQGSPVITPNTTVAPDGSLTADTLAISPSNYVYQSINITAGVTYTLSCWVKVASGVNQFKLNIFGSGNNFTSDVKTATTNWQQFSFTFTSIASGATNLYAPIVDGLTGGNFYIWGADLRVANDGVNQPAYQRVNTSTDYDTVGFKPYLRFNGTNQWLQTNSIDFTYGDKMFVSAGVRKLSDATLGITSEIGTGSGAGRLYLAATNGGPNYLAQFAGSTPQITIVTGAVYPAPITNVLSGIGDISGDQAILRVNGTQAAISTADQGTGNYGNYPLFIGARAGSSLWFNGRLYSLIVAGKLANAVEITETEKYVNGKTAAY